MFDSTTIILVVLTLSASGAAVFSIVKLSQIKKNLSELGMRVLESQDIGKIKEAANKAASFEARIAGFEQKTDESKNQLAELKTKLNELADKLSSSEQKIASSEARFDELTRKLESIDQKAIKNEDGLAQTVPNIKALADEIQNIKMFQTATEKIHSLIQAAFTDIQTSMPHEEMPGTTLDVPKPEDIKLEDAKSEEALKELEDWQKEDVPNKVPGSRRWQS